MYLHFGRVGSDSLYLNDIECNSVTYGCNTIKCSKRSKTHTLALSIVICYIVTFTYLFHKCVQPIQEDMCSGNHQHHCCRFHCSCKVMMHRSWLLSQIQKKSLSVKNCQPTGIEKWRLRAHRYNLLRRMFFKQDQPISQSFPVNPAWHSHLYEPAPVLKHMPPFWQGFSLHLLRSVKEKFKKKKILI